MTGQQNSDPRPIERRLESIYHKTEMKIWAGQNFLAAHIEFPKGQHVLSLWLYFDLNLTCFSNFTFQFMIHANFAIGA